MLHVLDRIAAIKPQEFVTPVPNVEKVTVHAFWQGIPYRFRLGRSVPGWWHVIPVDRSTVRQTKQAEAWEIYSYLSQLPRFYAITTAPVDESTWLVVPYNGADATQRGWRDSAPKQVHLVGHSLRPLDVVVVRSLAGMLLYEDIDMRLGNSYQSESYRELVFSGAKNTESPRDWMNAINIIGEWRKDIIRRESIKKIEERTATLEERARWQLEFMGATLLEMNQESGGYLVKWIAPDGQQKSTIIRQDTRVETAGICLTSQSGVDTSSQHNLSSIVKVMEGRGGGYRQDWDEYDDD